MVSIRALGNSQTFDIYDCNGCKLAKFSSLTFNRSIFVSSFAFDLIHSDVYGLLLFPQKRVSILYFFY
jgi:hypothetical protein